MCSFHYNSHKNLLFEESQHKCYYCGVPVSLKSMTIDHIIPHGFGGGTFYDNKVCSCSKCNRQKGIKTVDGFISGWTPRRKSRYLKRVEQDYNSGRLSSEKYLRLTGQKTSEGLRLFHQLLKRFHWCHINISINVWVTDPSI